MIYIILVSLYLLVQNLLYKASRCLFFLVSTLLYSALPSFVKLTLLGSQVKHYLKQMLVILLVMVMVISLHEA